MPATICVWLMHIKFHNKIQTNTCNRIQSVNCHNNTIRIHWPINSRNKWVYQPKPWTRFWAPLPGRWGCRRSIKAIQGRKFWIWKQELSFSINKSNWIRYQILCRRALLYSVRRGLSTQLARRGSSILWWVISYNHPLRVSNHLAKSLMQTHNSWAKQPSQAQEWPKHQEA